MNLGFQWRRDFFFRGQAGLNRPGNLKWTRDSALHVEGWLLRGERKEFHDLAKQPLSNVVRVTVRPTSYLILGARILFPSVGALFSRCISITCTWAWSSNFIDQLMPSLSSGRLIPLLRRRTTGTKNQVQLGIVGNFKSVIIIWR